jgi:hypothetical protein
MITGSILDWKPTVVTEVFRGFTQPLQADIVVITSGNPWRILSCPSQTKICHPDIRHCVTSAVERVKLNKLINKRQGNSSYDAWCLEVGAPHLSDSRCSRAYTEVVMVLFYLFSKF